MTTTTQTDKLATELQEKLDLSEQMWKGEFSPAYIVGYLQGVIKKTIEELQATK
jgi:hypothetical protein